MNLELKLSDHFTLKEMIRSEVAVENCIDNTPNEEQLDNLVVLCNELLEPIRSAFGYPVRVNSGFRTATLNTLVDGVKNSQHLEGKAADITSIDRFNDLMNVCLAYKGSFDQIIIYPKRKFIHVSYVSEIDNRRKLFVNLQY